MPLSPGARSRFSTGANVNEAIRRCGEILKEEFPLTFASPFVIALKSRNQIAAVRQQDLTQWVSICLHPSTISGEGAHYEKTARDTRHSSGVKPYVVTSRSSIFSKIRVTAVVVGGLEAQNLPFARAFAPAVPTESRNRKPVVLLVKSIERVWVGHRDPRTRAVGADALYRKFETNPETSGI